MTDVPQHVLAARIISDYEDPSLRFFDHFTIEWAMAPTALFYALFVPLQKLVGPFWDARLYLTFWVASMWLSTWYLARVRGQSAPWIAAIMALPLAFSWYAYKGFLPFLMSMPLFALTLALWFRDTRRPVKILSVWTLLSITFGFHIVGAAAAAAAILISAFTEALFFRARRSAMGLAVIAVSPVPLLSMPYLLGESRPSTSPEYAGFLGNVVDVLKFTVTTLNDAAALLLLIWVCLLGLLSLVWWRRMANALPTLLGAGGLALLSATLPTSLGALWPAGPRLFPFAIVLLIVSLPWHEMRRSFLAGWLLAFLFALSTITTQHTLALDKDLRNFLSGLDVIKPGGRILPILVEPDRGSRWVDPFWSLISAYTVEKGGVHPYVFAAPHVATGASPIKYRFPSERTFAFLYDPVDSNHLYKGASESYDYVLLWGASPAIESVLSQEMQEVHARGKATLYARREQPLSTANPYPPFQIPDAFFSSRDSH